jgi:hypothetical protein
MMTVPIALASVAAQLTQSRAVRQSRGPFFVARNALIPPNTALRMLPLKMNLRTLTPWVVVVQRYLASMSTATCGRHFRDDLLDSALPRVDCFGCLDRLDVAALA